MKRIAANSLILMVCSAALLWGVFLGNTFLFSPGHLLIPHNLPTSTIVDIFVLCVLPGILTAAVYVLLSVYSKNVERNFMISMLNFLPYVLLVSVILVFDNTFSHATRNFGTRGFISYETVTNVAFVFPNASRIWLIVMSASVVLAALKQLILPRFKTEPHRDEKSEAENSKTAASSKCRISRLLHYTAAILVPSIFLFDLYNRNRVENSLAFDHVLILAGILAVLGVLLFIVFKSATRSPEGAVVLCILFWLGFWLFETIFGVVANAFTALTSTQLMLLLAAVLASVAAIFRSHKPPGEKIRPVFNALSTAFVGLFIFNLIPGVNHEILLLRGGAAWSDEENAPFYIKREFYIDETLPTPDIYWVHLDGMMSMETVERFFEGACQEHLREELALRGFVVYPNAELNAGFTIAAMPALLSPSFYDSFWGESLNQVETYLRNRRAGLLSSMRADAGIPPGAPHDYELLFAFIERGYGIKVLRDVFNRIQRFEHIADNHRQFTSVWHRLLYEAGDLPELLNQTTPLNITPNEARADTEVLQAENNYAHIAKFTWMTFMNAHMHVVWRLDPAISERDTTAVHVYPLAYTQTAKSALNFIDAILDDNPNAVIVLQSDHGFHITSTQQFMLDQGYSLQQVMELIHSVFSAVRIPEQYGGLDAPIAPLNISRELVNRFVGENYELQP